MMTGNVAALKNLYRELGGSYADVENLTTIVDVLNAISQMYGGRTDATINPDAINNIADVAGDITGTSMFTKFIERTLVNLRIKEGIETIGKEAFYRCSKLKNVIIPNGVTTIGEYAFTNCNALESVIIPDSVTTIGKFAFSSCFQLKNVIIPDSVTTISNGAFANCNALESVIIPNGVTTIGVNAFLRVAGTIYCRFSEGTVAGAPWGATGTIVYDYQG